MQKWEYLMVVSAPPGWMGDKQYTLNGATQKYGRGENLFTLFARLGGEGWGLVNFPTVALYFFKRPLAK